MESAPEVWITGLGIVGPIGIGADAFWQGLVEGRSGVRDADELKHCPIRFGGEVQDFRPGDFVRPRKTLKMMCREIQMAFAAGIMAQQAGGIEPGKVDPDRVGVILGSETHYSELADLQPVNAACMEDGELRTELWGERFMREIHPLWMLKYLPNMASCHVAISADARGVNDSIVLGEASSLLAVMEAAHTIRRGAADIMLSGGVGCRLRLGRFLFVAKDGFSRRNDAPAAACRPFDADRDGAVFGEGAAVLVLERAEHARARGAEPLARVLGGASTYRAPQATPDDQESGWRQAIELAVERSGLAPEQLGCVNAEGISKPMEDAVEAQAIRKLLGDVPVTALKSYFGNAGGGAGALELVGGILALKHGLTPRTLNYETPDPDCPINVLREPAANLAPHTLFLNRSSTGQLASLIVSGDVGQ